MARSLQHGLDLWGASLTIGPFMKQALILVCLVFGLAGCVNVSKDRREQLRRDTDVTKPQAMPARRAYLRYLLLGGKNPRDPDPHVRATCAQLLGEVGEPEDLDSLMVAIKGLYADDNVMVRLECAIAIGKLRYAGITDRRRKQALSELTNLLALERDTAGRIKETDYQVRNALINSLGALGHRDSASALLDVARRMRSDLQNLETAVFTGAGEEGLFDQCLETLRLLTGVTLEKARQNRSASDSIDDHLQWWGERIAEMPQVPLG